MRITSPQFCEKVHKLYGDGQNDDYAAIQELLDSGVCEVSLPAPEKFYLISATLKIHSGQRLILPRYAVIRMADGCNCHMLENADIENGLGNCDFEVTGGIWDYNNLGQAKNPFHFLNPDYPAYDGFVFFFKNVRNFKISSLTMKDPITFCITLDIASYFTVENITFDFNYGNPWAVNMDGVHLDGNCHYGTIRNLKGSCYDDLVALNADEGSDGPISNIDIDGIFAENCHSAVRLLSVKNRVEHIHISNVYGTYYQYCIGVTKYYEGESSGWYDSLIFENLHIAKAERLSLYQKDGSMEYPLIWFENNLLVKSAVIEKVYRTEEVCGVPLIKVESGTVIETLSVSEVSQNDVCRKTSAVIENSGNIGKFYLDRVRTNFGKVYALSETGKTDEIIEFQTHRL